MQEDSAMQKSDGATIDGDEHIIVPGRAAWS
jgi:hypothetical protein